MLKLKKIDFHSFLKSMQKFDFHSFLNKSNFPELFTVQHAHVNIQYNYYIIINVCSVILPYTDAQI